MADISPHLKLLEDALTEETRKERRNLLIASTVGIAIVKTGLIPKEVSAFGVVTDVNEKGLLWVLTGVTIYFLIAFLVYAYADYQKHQYTWSHGISSRMDEFNKSHNEYKFMETSEGMMLMQTYVPRDSRIEELFRLQAQLEKLEKTYESKEVAKLALERGHTLLDLRHCERSINNKIYSKKAKESARREMEDLRAKLKDLNKLLTALGAQELIELQDREVALNSDIADSVNKRVDRYYEEIGLDFSTSLRFMPAATLRLVVDFIIPIGTAIFAIVCLLRGR